MEAAVAEAVDSRAQLKTGQVEAATWKEAALRTIGVIESLKKLIFTLETEASRVSAQSTERLESADRFISSLQLSIQARDREISRLTGRLFESRAQQAAIHGVETAYYRQLQEATMAMCNRGDHTLRSARGFIEDQSRVRSGLRNRLRHRRVPCLLDPSLTVSALTGADAPGLNPRVLDLASCAGPEFVSLVSSSR